jgi:photosystem II stability/assembly factor-like uncharacterized protein
MKLFCLTMLLLGLCGSIAHAQWQRQPINSDANFRGLCAVSAQVAWVSGTKGTYGRTTDGGKTWLVGTVTGAAKLDFRDVEAFGATTAYLLGAGPGEDSRIYKTVDGGGTWSLQFKNSDRDAFFVTDDGGTHWKPLEAIALPPTLPNEGCFAASGTCLVAHGANDVWFCTGGAKTARVFHSHDRGLHWTVSNAPIVAGSASAGIFSIAFRDANHGLIVGGDYRKPNEPGPNAAITADGGNTWARIERPFAYRSGVAWAKDHWIAVGTSGSDLSQDNGATWKSLDHENYNSVAFTPIGEGWAVGPRGRIAKFAN